MALELEAKFAVESLARVAGRLRGLHAVPRPARAEANIVYDTPERALLARGELLRLRRTDKAVLTWKRPAPGEAVEGMKAMEEVETRVEDFEAMRAILNGLGYREALRYEKCRQVWTLPDAVVCLDLLPFGEFVEIEGTSQSIAATAALLGLDMAAASARTYHDLFRLHLAAHGLPEGDSFVFSPADDARVRAFLEEFQAR
uniref:CYTH domain-containing protein n=1 Tax=Fundidesulfovibrio putealis TaxID=270496 RepID=A0A7C4EJ36_9BACT